ncbi:hypothetical protein [Variovorax ginsengisoli]|uniref:Transmembrane protein n=1 Tax=Variovorax ginsengisoli TaxID=363844 RepID=A0ABT9SAG0_9BURK|nr:hypothetical protein [Variovorax ginsengisoli]MDP9901345.1 hypothetical protein [Variovorax ginsengisoli]
MPVTPRRLAQRLCRCRAGASQGALVILFASFALLACSPTFNWRETPLGADGLVALLPCKPDRATRELPMGADPVRVEMVGCEAGGATFAVAHAQAADAAQAEAWLRAWRAAWRAQLDGAVIVGESAAHVPRAALSPSAVRLDAPPPGTAGGRVDAGTGAHVLWFAQARGGKMALYQATVIGEPSASDALATFFDGLRLP